MDDAAFVAILLERSAPEDFARIPKPAHERYPRATSFYEFFVHSLHGWERVDKFAEVRRRELRQFLYGFGSSKLPLAKSPSSGLFIAWRRLADAAGVKKRLPSDGTSFTTVFDKADAAPSADSHHSYSAPTPAEAPPVASMAPFAFNCL